MSTTTNQLDTRELEDRVKRMYEEVALEPDHEFHFETGRALAERLGYPPADRFVSDRADNATQKYGVTSISLLARRTGG
jgi:hypothetical protein